MKHEEPNPALAGGTARMVLRSRIYAAMVALSGVSAGVAWWGRTADGHLTGGDALRFPLVLAAQVAIIAGLLLVPSAEAWFGIAAFAAFSTLALVKQVQLVAGEIDPGTRLVQLLDLWPWISVIGLLPFVGMERQRATLAAAAFVVALGVVSAGAYVWRPSVDPTLLARLVLANACSIGFVASAVHLNDRTARAEAQAEAMRDLALRDTLTGIANRRALTEHLVAEIAHSTRTGAPTSVVLLDVDHFKRVNDQHGHDAGDRVLVQVADHLFAAVRVTDTAGRWGGEEFAVVARDTAAAGAADLADRIRLAIAGNVRVDGSPITASFGVAQWAPGMGLETLMQRADEALYEAKRTGRNRVCVARTRTEPDPTASLSPTSPSA